MLFSGALERSTSEEYDRVLQIAQIADRANFHAIWLPERHLTRFGAPYPNPLLVLAAIATSTERLALRAGSLVAPLHDAVRITEDLGVLDNLSRGRVEVAFASGWHPNDFISRPEAYANRRAITLDRAVAVERLWQGAPMLRENGLGQSTPVATLPRPIRPRLPIWLTAAGTHETYAAAGRLGYDLLTHVLGGDLAALQANVAAYRGARSQAGLDPAKGRVALMLHTFLGESQDEVVALAEGPFTEYLKSIAPLGKGLADARAHSIDVDKLEPQQLERFARFQFERLSRGKALFGTPEGVLGTVQNLAAIGVDEIACLIDFGISGDIVQDHLTSLIRLRDMVHTCSQNDAKRGNAAC